MERPLNTGATPPCHVLVADDEPHIGRIIKMKLEQGPFRVTLVYDGRDRKDLPDDRVTLWVFTQWRPPPGLLRQ